MNVLAHPLRGLVIAGRYTLSHELAHGGMSSVWLAEDSGDGRQVAVKFQQGLRADSNHQRRFRREVRALGQLKSPHIVQVLESGSDEGLTYIVMELLSGETLRQRAERCGRLPVAEVQEIIGQVSLGLESAHAAGIVHRDIKPSNLFMAAQGGRELLKIIDFGIAKGDSLEATLDVTGSGLIGSPAYMSPEQARGESVDQRADLWALAVVAFRLLSGNEAFAAANVPATLQRICMGPVPRFSAQAPDLPRAFDSFFARAFDPECARRQPSAAEFRADFERACAGEPEALAAISVRATSESPEASVLTQTGAPLLSVSVRPSPVRVKGQAFHSVLRALGELRGEDFRCAVLAEVGGEGGVALREGSLLSPNFYPVAWYRELFAAAQRVAPSWTTLGRDAGLRSGQRDIAGMYRVLLRALSTETMIKQSSRLLRVVYDSGGVDVLELRRGFARVRYHDYYGFDFHVWQDAIGGGTAAFEATGAKKLAMEVEQGGGDGDANMVVCITWQ